MSYHDNLLRMKRNYWVDEDLMLLLLYIKMKNKRVKRKHKCWVKDIFLNRKQQGDQHLYAELKIGTSGLFQNYFRMSKDRYQSLLELVGPKITKVYWSRQPISPSVRLAITIR